MSSPARDELDAELMRTLAEGDDLALNRLMDAWSQPLISYLMRLTGSHATACDLAQESFVRVHRHRLEYRTSQKFSTWLFAIATNLARNHARWRSRHPEALTEPENLRELPIASTHASPDQQAAANERLAAVQKAVSELPHDMREVLILSTWHGQSHTEIARVQNTSEKAVELRLYRARKLLREMLGGQL
ncbi:MAG: RNA polymerase sigma factor [Prosthecobacter sp.]|jgi:RNA polymerase sigma-70 factor (ECF subfamily)|uniref:RNA polymerase sigma factor n=1 Tax=Prosthecobacter sp. TaxID=1965333 RepID=UPI001A0DF32A|nr:RNA polymerase sigma factor [Prosthecobacter sp.]MBE2284825.1 RNA polymerase sigma factor [Prosthecobacter sp.]